MEGKLNRGVPLYGAVQAVKRDTRFLHSAQIRSISSGIIPSPVHLRRRTRPALHHIQSAGVQRVRRRLRGGDLSSLNVVD